MCHPEVGVAPLTPDVRTEEAEIPVSRGDLMPCLLAIPKQIPAPSVVIVNDFFGRSPFYEELARRLADAGFLALDPEYFFREGPLIEQSREAAFARVGQLDHRRTIVDLGTAVKWIRRRGEASGKVAAMGFCMGGTLVLGLAASHADIDATVCYYGFPRLRKHTRLSPPEPLTVAAHMRGPILGHWGDQDESVGMDSVAELDDRLTAAHIEHEFYRYPGVGHGFLRAIFDELPSGYVQANDSWERTLSFLRQAVGRSVAGT